MRLTPVFRIVTFVPPEHREAVMRSVVGVTNLRYGKYTEVAWWSAIGTEQFKPLSGSHPTVGRQKALIQTPSVRLEFSIPRDRTLLQLVVREGIRAVHPWEEPVIIVTNAHEARRHAR